MENKYVQFRTEKELLKRLKHDAVNKEQSLNQWMNNAIEGYLKARPIPVPPKTTLRDRSSIRVNPELLEQAKTQAMKEEQYFNDWINCAIINHLEKDKASRKKAKIHNKSSQHFLTTKS